MKWENKPLVRFTLRLPEDLHHKIKKKIANNYFGCSINDFVVKAILRALDQNIPM